jgi:hypothetical protein
MSETFFASTPRSSIGASMSREAIAFSVMFRCVSSAPFGCPVVPDVYRMTAVSYGSVGNVGNVDGWCSVSCPSVIDLSTGLGFNGSIVMTTRCVQAGASSQPERAIAAMGSSAVPSNTSSALASLSVR